MNVAGDVQFLFEALQIKLFLIAQSFALEAGVDARMQDAGFERFGKIIIRAFFDSLYNAFQVVVRRDDNDGNVPHGRVSFGLVKNREAIHDGHHDIEQHEVGRCLLYLFQCLLPVDGCYDLVIQFRKFLFKIIDIEGFVIHDQDAGLLIHRLIPNTW